MPVCLDSWNVSVSNSGFRISDRVPGILPYELRVTAITENNPKDPNRTDLAPMLGERWALQPRHLVVCLFFCAAFVFVNSLPLLDWAVWRNVSVGRWILDHGTLPLDDPTQPLSEGVPFIHGNWLAQVALAAADRLGGPQGVVNLLTVLTVAYMAILARVVYRQTDRIDLMLLGVVLSFLISDGFGLFAPETVFGRLCFALLFWLLGLVPKLCRTHAHTRKTRRTVQFVRQTVPFMRSCVRDAGKSTSSVGRWWLGPAMVLGTAGLFAFWANLHESYLLGIAVLVCYALAQAGEVIWQLKSLRLAVADDLFRAYVMLAATAVLASLLNPYGPNLAIADLAALCNVTPAILPAWGAFDLAGLPGVTFFGSLGLLAILLLADWPQVRAADVLLPAMFAAAVLMNRQAQSWYALAYVFVAMPHLAHFVGRGRWWGVTVFGRLLLPSQRRKKQSVSIRRSIAEMGLPSPEGPSLGGSQVAGQLTPRSFLGTLLCGLAVYCAFCLAPGTQTLLGGSPRSLGELVGSADAARAAEWLREHAPNARVYALPRWSDLLVGLGGDGVTAMMTSNGQWAPQSIWTDHCGIALGADGWEQTLQKCGIDILVLSPSHHAPLIQAVKLSHEWTAVFQTKHAFLARRETGS